MSYIAFQFDPSEPAAAGSRLLGGGLEPRRGNIHGMRLFLRFQTP